MGTKVDGDAEARNSFYGKQVRGQISREMITHQDTSATINSYSIKPKKDCVVRVSWPKLSLKNTVGRVTLITLSFFGLIAPVYTVYYNTTNNLIYSP